MHFIMILVYCLPIPISSSLLIVLVSIVAAIVASGAAVISRQQRLNADLNHQMQERTTQLQQALDFEATLKRITDQVRDSLDESQIMQTAVQELVGLGAICCNAAMYDHDQETSTIRYEYTTSSSTYQGRVVQMAPFTEVYTQLKQGQYFQFCSIIPNPTRGRVAMLACPLLDDQGVLGDLWLVNQKDYTFSELEVRLVQQVANQCAIAIRQARLFQATQAQVQELEKLNRLKDDFLSTVSHELRSPVSNMRVAIQMLLIAPDSHRRQRYLQILHDECDREVVLINNLLDLQRLEAASYSTVFEAVNLQAWLPSIVEPFRSRTQECQQILHIDLPPSLPLVISEATSLGRILAELLNNACKYTPAGGKISLSVRHDTSPSAGVIDSSVAMPSNGSRIAPPVIVFTVGNEAEISTMELPRIFEKFYRVANSDRWKQGGTGLGLALVQKLVEQLQGSIQVDSEEGWTTFTIQLPAQLET